jgi:hypothetical protein
LLAADLQTAGQALSAAGWQASQQAANGNRSAARAGKRSTGEDSSAGEAARFVCARCGEVIGTAAPVSPADGVTSTEACFEQTVGAESTTRAQFDAWQWELDQELHDVRYLLQSRGGHAERPAEYRESLYNDVTQALATESPAITRRVDMPATVSPPRRAAPNSAPFFWWLVFAFGLMGLTCGSVLLAWSVVTGRSELWRVGLPIMLAGQAVSLIGLVFLLEGLWRDSRESHEQLPSSDPQWEDRRTGPLMAQSHAAGGRRYYADPYHTAHPYLVLANIKRQLDELSDTIGSD